MGKWFSFTFLKNILNFTGHNQSVFEEVKVEYFNNFIMIVTYQRSGSTLLQALLNEADNCTIRGENMNVLLHIFSSYLSLTQALNKFSNFKNKHTNWPFYGVYAIDKEAFFAMSLENFMQNVLGISELRGVENIGFKEVKYDLFGERLPQFLDLMKKHIPNLKIVFNFRNHDDVCNSAWNKDKDPEVWKQTLTEFETLCREFHENNQNWTTIVQYEDYIHDINTLKHLFHFLECQYDKKRLQNVLSVKLTHGKDTRRYR